LTPNGVRHRSSTLGAELNRTISRAFEQLDTTAGLIRSGHAALTVVPDDRPIYGLVVTLEPYPFINAPFARDELQVSPPSIPIAVTSIQDFERLVADAIADPLDAAAIASLVGPGGDAWDVDLLVQRKVAEGNRNPLLDTEFSRLTRFAVQLPGGGQSS
jgi:hypothetical protein